MAKRHKNPNGRSTIYRGADGKWHGRVTMGVRDDGRTDRRHVERKSKAEVVAEVRRLEKERDSGQARAAGKRWTVEGWLVHWLENIAKPNLRATAYSAYRVAVTKHLVPGVGAHWLDKLEPEHLERLYARMIGAGSKAGTAHQAHRTARTALGEAVRRRHIPTNPAAIARAPRVTEDDVEPYSVEEVQRILAAASRRRNATRWAIALSLGLRQGEALALRWPDVNLDAGSVRIRWTLLRPTYEHGCKGRCKQPKAGYCPQRRRTNPEIGPTKSRAGKRVIGLPGQLVQMLRSHALEQAKEREVARQLWTEGDWVFTTPTGAALNPNTDYHEWKTLLRAAGVRDARLHDARHTAATVLLALGVPERAAMGIMGWSSTAMAARYQHMTDPIRQDIAGRVGGLLWPEPEVDTSDGESDAPDSRDKTGPDDPDDGLAGVRVPA